MLVAQLGGLVLPLLRDATRLNRLLLFLAVALLRRSNQAGIDDLARHRDIAGSANRLIEPDKQSLDRIGLHQPLPERPDRAGIGNPVTETQSQKAHE